MKIAYKTYDLTLRTDMHMQPICTANSEPALMGLSLCSVMH